MDHCDGSLCPLKLLCRHFNTHNYLKQNGMSLAFGLIPQYKNGNCCNYEQMEFYGN